MASEFEKLKKKLYFKRSEMIFNKAVLDGKITEFDEEIYERMKDTIISCLPVSIFIKHSKHLFPKGSCYDRSLYMFLALDDAILVRGNNKDLEYRFGKSNSGHGWVEVGDYVYDPSLMLKFDKATYYKLYGCSNVKKVDRETYASRHQKFIDEHVSYDSTDYKPGGKRRLDLGLLIYQTKALSHFIGDEELSKDLDEYLTLIEYDEEQILEEKEKLLQIRFSDSKFSKMGE